MSIWRHRAHRARRSIEDKLLDRLERRGLRGFIVLPSAEAPLLKYERLEPTTGPTQETPNG